MSADLFKVSVTESWLNPGTPEARRVSKSTPDKPTGAPVWGGTWASDRRGAEMLRMDLEAAGIPYVIEGTDGPLFADFHALRHSYLTLGGRAGIDLRTLQELAGHRPATLATAMQLQLAGAGDDAPGLVGTRVGDRTRTGDNQIHSLEL